VASKFYITFLWFDICELMNEDLMDKIHRTRVSE